MIVENFRTIRSFLAIVVFAIFTPLDVGSRLEGPWLICGLDDPVVGMLVISLVPILSCYLEKFMIT